jgi:hypothetical protein
MKRMTGAAMAAAAGVMALASCGGGGGADGAGFGTLRAALTDAPSCGYDHVYVTVDRVRVHRSSTAGDDEGGWREIVLSTPKRIDLLDLTNGVLEELGQTSLPAGTYSQVRLVLAENSASAPLANAVQPTGGALVALSTPSAQQSGLKLKASIEVQENKTADLVLDFDACRSVVTAGNSGRYNLKPVLSVVPRVTTGIEGYVSTTLTPAGTTVSAQQNGTVVRSTVPDANGRFVLNMLPQGSYDIVVVAEGRSTAVVTGVPVASTTTTLNASGSAILPPASVMREIAGTVTAAPAAGGGTTPTLVTDATVRATQSLTGGPAVEVRHQPVDGTLATYRLRVPAGAPVKAAWAASGLTFNADNTVAGKYTVQAAAPGRTAVTAAADVAAADASVSLGFAP